MVPSLTYTFPIILLNLVTGSLGNDNATERYNEAYNAAYDVLVNFFQLFQTCVGTSMGNKNYVIDNLQAYLFYPAKTTVGYAPKFTSNRKFFAHLIGTKEFNYMIKEDMSTLRESLIDKLKFCDNTVMDETMLKDLHDKEYVEISILK